MKVILLLLAEKLKKDAAGNARFNWLMSEWLEISLFAELGGMTQLAVNGRGRASKARPRVRQDRRFERAACPIKYLSSPLTVSNLSGGVVFGRAGWKVCHKKWVICKKRIWLA